MPIELPRFQNPYFQALRACGSIQTKDRHVLDEMAKVSGNYSSEYKAGKSTPLLTVVLGQTEPTHMHIDIVKTLSKVDRQSETLSPSSEVLGHLSPFLGTEIKINLSGRFVLPYSKLPKQGLIRSFSFESDDNLGISMTGGEFEISGDMPFVLDWRLVKRGANPKVKIELDTYVVTDISSDYLLRLTGLLDSVFQLYVLGKRPNGPSTTQAG